MAGPRTCKHRLARVSIIIPTHNRSQLLRVAVESALAQTYPNLEIIVVDDGSTDNTARMMGHYAGRVLYIRQANQDVAAARNTGIRAASGEYLTFLDDDDFILPTKLERQVQLLDARPEIGLVHCGYYHTDEAGNPIDRVTFLPEGDVLKELVCGNFIWVGAPLIRRECFDQTGVFDDEIPAVGADWDMWLRIAQAGYLFACVQEPLGAYRMHQDSMLANVAGLEHATLVALDQVFANPALPAGVVAIKEQAYGTWRLWLSGRYYATGLWENGRRNLAEALALRPQLLKRPAALLQLLSDEALGPRVADPVRFVTGVLDHLPAVAGDFSRYRLPLLGKVYLGLALRQYGRGEIASATRALAEAIALDPTILEQPHYFADALSNHAMRLPIDAPLAYVETVLQNLPAQARSLAHVRPRVLGEVNIGCAFQDYFAGRRRLTTRRVLTALRYQPAWLGNPGVVSIFLKSLLGSVSREHSPS